MLHAKPVFVKVLGSAWCRDAGRWPLQRYACGFLHLQGDIIPVEGLLLDDVAPGLHTVHCLPLKLVGSDGAPARCILIQ